MLDVLSASCVHPGIRVRLGLKIYSLTRPVSVCLPFFSPRTYPSLPLYSLSRLRLPSTLSPRHDNTKNSIIYF